VGSGAARGKIGCEQGPTKGNRPYKAPTASESFSNRTKYPVPTLSSRKKVAGSREPMKLNPLEIAVNKKFGPGVVPCKGRHDWPRARKITS